MNISERKYELFSHGLITYSDFGYEIDEIVEILLNNSVIYGASDHRFNLLIIPNSAFFASLFYEFYQRDFEVDSIYFRVDRGLFCIGSGGRSNCGDYMRLSKLDYICNQDFIITYNESFDPFLYGLVINISKEETIQEKVIQSLFGNFEICKTNFSLLKQIKIRPEQFEERSVYLNIYKKIDIQI